MSSEMAKGQADRGRRENKAKRGQEAGHFKISIISPWIIESSCNSKDFCILQPKMLDAICNKQNVPVRHLSRRKNTCKLIYLPKGIQLIKMQRSLFKSSVETHGLLDQCEILPEMTRYYFKY